ncbi:hypothetical protein B0H19DRAFT_964113 [Mycena capillaripes]|nr:hypothetical protein B0H19DRAFT_964113 [Mycena capillaripes]
MLFISSISSSSSRRPSFSPSHSVLTRRFSQTSGQIDSVVGTAKEAVGNMTGMQSMQKDGKEQHMKGEAEQKTAQAQEYGSGMLDRASGAIKEMAGGLMGDSTQKAEGKMQNAAGQAKTEANKPM